MNEIDQKRALLAMCGGFVIGGIVLIAAVIQCHIMGYDNHTNNIHGDKNQYGLIHENRTPDSIWIYKGYFNTNSYE